MKDAMSMLDEAEETPAQETPAEDAGDSMDGQITDAISGTAAGAKLSPEELSEVVSAVMGVVAPEENSEDTSSDEDTNEFDNLVSKKPHPFGKEFDER